MPSEERQSDNPDTDRELASLKQEFDDLREHHADLRSTVEQLQAQRRGIVDAFAERTGMSRREILTATGVAGVGMAVGGAGSYSAVEPAAAGASAADSDGDVGTSANPVDVFGDGGVFNEINNVEWVAPSEGGSGIQSAIDKVENAGGGTVKLQAGTYTSGQRIELPANVSLVGQGTDATTIQYTAAVNGLMVRESGGTVSLGSRTSVVQPVHVEGIHFDGNATGSIGWYLSGMNRSTFTNCRVNDFTSHGIQIEGQSGPGGCYYNTFTDVGARNNDRGWYLYRNGAGVNSNWLYNCRGDYNDSEGLYLYDVWGNVIHGSWEQNLAAGTEEWEVQVTGSAGTRSHGNRIVGWVEGNDKGVYFDQAEFNDCFFTEVSTTNSVAVRQRSISNKNRVVVAQAGVMKQTTLSGGSAGPFSLLSNHRVRDAEPVIIINSPDGYPIQYTFTTDVNGDYDGFNLQALNFDGTNRSSDTDVNFTVYL